MASGNSEYTSREEYGARSPYAGDGAEHAIGAAGPEEPQGLTEGGEASAKREAKDSVFCDLFSQGRYLLRFYRDLHPEDGAVAAGDVSLVTLDRVLTNGQFNDLGFMVRDRLVVLAEAQSTWSPNIVVRMLFYLADTYRRHIARTEQNKYRATAVRLPAPELLVVFTGSRREVPGELSFARDILGLEDCCVDVRVRVIRDCGGILGEYVAFTRAFDEKRKELGYTLAAIEATIDACVEASILREYLIERRKEVVRMMHSMIDHEEAHAAFEQEVRESSFAKGLEQGLEQGREEGREEGIEQGQVASLSNLMASTGWDIEQAMEKLGIPSGDRQKMESLMEKLDR